MRAARVVGTALLATAFLAVPGVAPVDGLVDGLVNGPPAAEAAASPAQEMLTLVNAERSKAGCAPVRLDARLNNAAAKHSTDMAANNYFSHTSRNGASFVTRIKAEGYPTPRSENIAAGRTTAQADADPVDEQRGAPQEHPGLHGQGHGCRRGLQPALDLPHLLDPGLRPGVTPGP